VIISTVILIVSPEISIVKASGRRNWLAIQTAREPKEDKDKVILPGTCIPEKYEVSKPKSSSVTSIKRFHKTIGRDNVRRV
jgi:hypothetical protein